MTRVIPRTSMPTVLIVSGLGMVWLLWATWGGDTPVCVAPVQDDWLGRMGDQGAAPLRAAGTGAAGSRLTGRSGGLTGLAVEREQAAWKVAKSGSLDEALRAVAHHQAKRSRRQLTSFAVHATDPRVRIRALQVLAVLFGAEARPILMIAVEDSDAPEKVRREAARLLGSTGSTAGVVLDRLIDTDLPPKVRGGAVLGLAELGTAAGAKRAVTLAATPEHPMRLEAAKALERMFAPPAARGLVAILTDETTAPRALLPAAGRVAVCRSLGPSRVSEAEPLLTALLEADESAAVRRAAAHALGVLGRKGAMDALATACKDPTAEVAHAAHVAWVRLSGVRD